MGSPLAEGMLIFRIKARFQLGFQYACLVVLLFVVFPKVIANCKELKIIRE